MLICVSSTPFFIIKGSWIASRVRISMDPSVAVRQSQSNVNL